MILEGAKLFYAKLPKIFMEASTSLNITLPKFLEMIHHQLYEHLYNATRFQQLLLEEILLDLETPTNRKMEVPQHTYIIMLCRIGL